MILTHTVKHQGTINSILTKEINISSKLLHKLIDKKLVFLNKTIVDTRNIAKVNDIITIDLNYDEDNSNILPCNMKLNIVYEDECFIVINKPAGITTHPSILHYSNSISNGIKFYFDSIGLNKKIRPVNRLDKNTSGLMIFAKNEYIQECLIKQMNTKTFKKEYLALVENIFENNTDGTITAPISRKPGSIIERHIDKNGKNSITHYKVINNYDDYSLVSCILETGRTHQIRVHMAYIKHPLLRRYFIW